MVLAHCEDSIYKEKDLDEDLDYEDEDDEPMGLCCMSGCLTGCSLGLLFIVVLPAGILLSLYSINNKDYGVLSAGIILILVPMISIPVLIVLYYNRRRLRKIRRFRKTRIDLVPGVKMVENNETVNHSQVISAIETKTRF
ncbi:uncharacterized protein [Mytilus edulis]|uniref:Transmembrane protein n=1 Tax=Mytilus galloprovincialis TaxID=29158 RepID=A0A8B6BZE6_MYTGA|nr:Hypothetical predicted protein [Mytilus galloprovincialis]